MKEKKEFAESSAKIHNRKIKKYPIIFMKDEKFKNFYSENIQKISKFSPNLTRRVTRNY